MAGVLLPVAVASSDRDGLSAVQAVAQVKDDLDWPPPTTTELAWTARLPASVTSTPCCPPGDTTWSPVTSSRNAIWCENCSATHFTLAAYSLHKGGARGGPQLLQRDGKCHIRRPESHSATLDKQDF